jgi:hypothetical protein
MDWRDSYHVTFYQCDLRYATGEGSVPRGYERIREWELISLDFRSSKGTAVWPEEHLDLACDVTCAVVTVILRE